MLTIYDRTMKSRLFLGTALYPSPATIAQAVTASGTGVLTVCLRRENRGGEDFWEMIKNTGCRVLPNTAGCYTPKEAVTTAHMAREVFSTAWVKLEVVSDPDTLRPEVFGTVEAARILIEDGFEVFPYTTEDLGVAEKLIEVGCKVLMPWGSPIGTGQGLRNPEGLRAMRARFPDIPLVVDAGIGAPSHAALAMEMGFDAVLLNTAVAQSGDPPAMAAAFADAVRAGRTAYKAGLMPRRDMAQPSTPVLGLAVLE